MAYDQALCPMCGTAHGTRAKVRKYGRTGKTLYRFGMQNHYARLLEEWDENKPFGVTQKANGRGQPMDIEYWELDDPRAEPFVEPMKALMLLSVKRALKQGLITAEEVTQAIETPFAPAPRPIPPSKIPDIETLLDTLQAQMDESKKTLSIRRIEAFLEQVSPEQVEGIDELKDAIQEYKGISKKGMTPEEYVDEKETAFEEVISALENLEIIEPEETEEETP